MGNPRFAFSVPVYCTDCHALLNPEKREIGLLFRHANHTNIQNYCKNAGRIWKFPSIKMELEEVTFEELRRKPLNGTNDSK